MGFSCLSQACSERGEWGGSAQSLSKEGDLGQKDLAAAQLGSGAVVVWEARAQSETEQTGSMAALSDSAEPGLVQGTLGQSLYAPGACALQCATPRPQGSCLDQLWNWL